MNAKKIFFIRRAFFKCSLCAGNFFRKTWLFLSGGETCVGCSAQTSLLPVCESCAKKLFVPDAAEKCRVCGKVLVSENGICSSCAGRRIIYSADACFSLISYRLWRKNLLFAWKSEEKRVLSPFFAELVYEKLKKISGGGDFLLPVVPVPPRPGKIKKKGWDQIDELCFYLKNLHGVEILPVLERLSRIQQKKLSRELRLEQMHKAYVLKNPRSVGRIFKIPPETAVLLDDVMTTGSTIEACAEELKKCGIKTVFVLTLFIVD